MKLGGGPGKKEETARGLATGSAVCGRFVRRGLVGSGDATGDLLDCKGVRSECRRRRSAGVRGSSRLIGGGSDAFVSTRNGEAGFNEGREGRGRSVSDAGAGTGTGVGAGVRESIRFLDQKELFLDSDFRSGSFTSPLSSAPNCKGPRDKPLVLLRSLTSVCDSPPESLRGLWKLLARRMDI